MDIIELIEKCPQNWVIADSYTKAFSKLNSGLYDKPVVAISGGWDSDVLLHIIHDCDVEGKAEYVWFDTGLEYQATKDHLKDLEDKYNIEIKVHKAVKPIPLSCRQYGQPFLSKHISEMIYRLQKHNFKWEDKPFEELYKEYPRCKVALQWWCNTNTTALFNISRNKYLKEFMVANPPTFKIANKCCTYAKKDVVKRAIEENGYDLNIMGVRRAEGGVRATAYKSCFDNNGSGYDNYRPLFWYGDADKAEFVEHFNIIPSKCYTEYGLKRTGCAGCPFGRDFEEELAIIEKYEPKLFRAVNKIFGNSYEYTRKYKAFCEEMEKQYSSYTKYLETKGEL